MASFGFVFFFFQAEDGIRDDLVTGVQTCALPISLRVGSAELTAVVARVIGPVLPRADRLPPPGAVPIPGDRLLQALLETNLGRPSQRPDLLGRQRVTPVVTGPIGDELDQRLVATA